MSEIPPNMELSRMLDGRPVYRFLPYTQDISSKIQVLFQECKQKKYGDRPVMPSLIISLASRQFPVFSSAEVQDIARSAGLTEEQLRRSIEDSENFTLSFDLSNEDQ